MFPRGWNLDSIKTLHAQEGRLSFVFKGRVYTDQPIGSTILSDYWTRLQQKLGLNPVSNPVRPEAHICETASSASSQRASRSS